VARERITHSEEVTVEVHAALGVAGRTRGEGDDRHVLGRGPYRLEVRRLGFHTRLELAARTKGHDVREYRLAGPGGLKIFSQVSVGQRVADPGFVDDGGQFASAEQRHGRDHDAASLEHAEPGRDQHRRVGRA
jgi:hypothetical protein